MLRMCCQTPHFMNWEEDRRGKIAPGMEAELVVLDGDPLTCDIGRLPQLSAVLSMVDGQIVHDARVRLVTAYRREPFRTLQNNNSEVSYATKVVYNLVDNFWGYAMLGRQLMFQTCSRRSSLLSNRRLSMLFPTAAMALIAVCITSVSYAQAVIEEVIVTATKRGAVSVQDLAGGIQAIGGDTIDDYDFRSVEEFARLSPSLNFATQGRGDSQLVIRGIQSPGSSSVGFYYDEAVITSANFQDGGGRTPDIGAYDMERIEILQGSPGHVIRRQLHERHGALDYQQTRCEWAGLQRNSLGPDDRARR